VRGPARSADDTGPARGADIGPARGADTGPAPPTRLPIPANGTAIAPFRWPERS